MARSFASFLGKELPFYTAYLCSAVFLIVVFGAEFAVKMTDVMNIKKGHFEIFESTLLTKSVQRELRLLMSLTAIPLFSVRAV